MKQQAHQTRAWAYNNSCPRLFLQIYFDDGDAVDLGDDIEDLRRQLDAIETGGFDKYQAYLDCAQVNLEVSPETRNQRVMP